MKKIFVVFLAFFILPICLNSPAVAQDTEEQQIEELAGGMDEQASDEEGKKTVVQKLKDQFNITDEQINGLREQGFGYGEIGIACSLADQMPDGITGENIQKIGDLRQGDKKMGWGNIAKQYDLKLGRVISQMHKADKAIKSQKVKKARTPKISRKMRSSGKSQKSSHTSKASKSKGKGHGHK